MLPPEVLSFTCPYCAATYAVDQTEVQALIPPTAIIPFAISQAEAECLIARWLEADRQTALVEVTPLAGLYFPAWTFDVRCDLAVEFVQKGHARPGLSDRATAFENDLPVPASCMLPESLADEVGRFRLDGLVPYDPCYLAGWPAETYQIPVADASLIARQKALARARQQAASRWGALAGPEMGMPRLAVESFRLILLPLWIARYRDGEAQVTVIVNGQTGAVRSDRPKKGVREWLSRLMGE